MSDLDFACKQCGADLKYDPKASALNCPYCGTENEIATSTDDIGEQDFHAFINAKQEGQETYDVQTAKCGSCGAESTLDPNVVSDTCPFCGDAIVKQSGSHKLIKPQSLLPFSVAKDIASSSFRSWLNKLWFAPNKLKKMRNTAESMQGVFLPHWTYDSDCVTSYIGRRGDYYYVNESYTTTNSKGQRVTRTRRVRKTRWYPAHGVVKNLFDDILVVASESLPKKYVEKLEPWGLENLVKFDHQFASGFKTESYTIDLDQGFEDAQDKMRPIIEQTIRRDIGGDTQRIINYSTGYKDITFKHILLPVWLSCYRYQEKVYRFVVNARTGEVQGERPWSAWKIGLAAVGGLVLIAAIVLLLNNQ